MNLKYLLISTVVLSALAACGGGSNSSSVPETPDPPESSGLSHVGTEIPTGNAEQQSEPLISTVGETKAQALSQNLGVIFEVVENHGDDHLEDCVAVQAEFASCSVVYLHLKDSDASLRDGNWKIYFHSVKRVLRVDSSEFRVVHVNGDLNYLAPTQGFAGFESDPVKTIKLITEFSHLAESEMMPRYWLVSDDSTATILPNTDTETDVLSYAVEITGDNRKAFNGERNPIADSANRYEKYAATQNLNGIDSVIIPTPRTVTTGTGTLTIGSGFEFDNFVLSAESIAALTGRLANFYTTANGAAGDATPVTTSISDALNPNEYRLVIDASGISVSGIDAQSVFYGAQSLLALITPGSNSIPYIDITDSPRFEYRGMHLDVARNFHSVDSVKKLIDQMSAYKMNKLHLHLSDDEGWRLEIPGLPELTSVGGTRHFQVDASGLPTEANGLLPQLGSGPNTDNQGSGFYTRTQFIELLQYAAARFVQVIPEIDMPGHARAAVVAMRARANNMGKPDDTTIRLDDPADTSNYLTVQHYTDGLINPCVEGTYNLISSVVTEINTMYTEAGTTLEVWHMGGDEAKSVYNGDGFPGQNLGDFPWEKSPVCQSLIAAEASISDLEDLTPYFITRIAEIVDNAGIQSLYAYQDILRNLQPAELATTKVGVGYWEVLSRGGFSAAYDWPNRGYETIVSVPDYLYFDFPHEVDPKERGTNWATRFTDTQKVFSFAPENLPQNAETSVKLSGDTFAATGTLEYAGFEGMQGQLWSETVRTPEQFDYMIFPRLLALAERAWHRAAWELEYAPGITYDAASGLVRQDLLAADWVRFANALGKKELPKLDASGVRYRVPTVGAKSVGNTISMNIEFPGLGIEYSADGSTWQAYNPASPPASVGFVRGRSASGERTGRATPVP